MFYAIWSGFVEKEMECLTAQMDGPGEALTAKLLLLKLILFALPLLSSLSLLLPAIASCTELRTVKDQREGETKSCELACGTILRAWKVYPVLFGPACSYAWSWSCVCTVLRGFFFLSLSYYHDSLGSAMRERENGPCCFIFSLTGRRGSFVFMTYDKS